ncbi:uncharacterized protein LOC132172695 [Corylus avellana]|uniref:uncharacterized protein LOC132172695 n=1 Tax=Corylus avellana TaxID=13451 RepID=UPI00286AFA25|nr:uncharacterized protein LOC132172695 [Corylus avellana]
MSRYDDLNGVSILRCRPLEWTDKELEKIRIYNVNQVDTDEIVLLGNSLIKDIEESKIKSSTVNIILSLAVSLIDPFSEGSKFLLIPPSEHQGVKISYKQPITTKGDAEEAELANLAKQAKNNKKESTTAKLQKQVDKINFKESNDDFEESEEEEEEVQQGSASVYTFLAAYLLRLQSKLPDGFVSSLDQCKNRYAGWYKHGREIMNRVTVSAEVAEKIKNALGRRPEIIHTWVMWIAVNENRPSESKLSVQQRGLVEYLAGQIFSYTGMHAYTLTMAIQETTKCELELLLRELNCPLTRSAVVGIRNIVKNHELKEGHSTQTTYFRYARVWDPGYFYEVETKSCIALVYLVAKTFKEIGTTSEVADPTKIYALTRLGEWMKAHLDVVSSRLVKMISSKLLHHS